MGRGFGLGWLALAAVVGLSVLIPLAGFEPQAVTAPKASWRRVMRSERP